jgi:hypothetical protein
VCMRQLCVPSKRVDPHPQCSSSTSAVTRTQRRVARKEMADALKNRVRPSWVAEEAVEAEAEEDGWGIDAHMREESRGGNGGRWWFGRAAAVAKDLNQPPSSVVCTRERCSPEPCPQNVGGGWCSVPASAPSSVAGC